MPIPIPDFEKEILDATRKNLGEVLKDLNDGEEGMTEKVKNFSELFGFTEETVRQKIKDDEMFRAQFAKHPGRQGIHEKLAAAFVEKIPGVKNFKVLAKGELQLLNGGVFAQKEVRDKGATRHAKTIDFEWETSDKKIYASHKYTKSAGGAQDNQYTDIQDFIREATQSHLPNTIFVAIADGSYYLMNDVNSKTTKLQRLKNLTNNRNVFAVSSDELEEFIKNI
jgi:hypothetical protein